MMEVHFVARVKEIYPCIYYGMKAGKAAARGDDDDRTGDSCHLSGRVL
jgi:hypothetical protein